MKLRTIRSFWSNKRTDFARVYRGLKEVERSCFDPKRRQLNEQEVKMLQLRQKITRKKSLYQKVSQGHPSIWNQFRSAEKRLEGIRKEVARLSQQLESIQQSYNRNLNHYNELLRAVSGKLQHQPSPDYKPIAIPQKTIPFVSRDRRSPENALTL